MRALMKTCSRARVFSLLLFAGGFFAGVPAFAVPAPAKPNVIFIYADDLGKGMISAFWLRHFKLDACDGDFANGVNRAG